MLLSCERYPDLKGLDLGLIQMTINLVNWTNTDLVNIKIILKNINSKVFNFLIPINRP